MLREQKVFKDNVLGYVCVDDQVIWDLINSPEFQRLRRIKHLGGVSMAFHTAEHSRFTHCLGVYEIARRMIDSIENLHLTDYERILVLCSALLHDLGHGPLSHTFEDITGIHHERMTIRIIMENTGITKVLNSYDELLANDICLVIQKQHERKILSSFISSQIDADRLDYLVRDSFNSGVVYGLTDIERIFRVAKVVDDKLCFKSSSIIELEIYLLSRLCMYKQLYFHPNARSYELVLKSSLIRYFDLRKRGYKFKGSYVLLDNLGSNIDLTTFYLLDDDSIIHYMKNFMFEDDRILSKLSKMFINRELFEFSKYFEEGELAPLSNDVKRLVEQEGYDSKYFCIVDTMKTKLYRQDEDIYVCKGDEILELDDLSKIIPKIDQEEKITYIYYPRELHEKVKNLLN